MDGQCSMLDTVGNDMVFGATGSRNSYRVLGLDPGIGSCGIALIDFGLEEVVYLGVHLWDVPQEPKTHTSTAVTRRNARSARRNIKRTADRKKHCYELLFTEGLVPSGTDSSHLQTRKGDKPNAKLRAVGLDRLLSEREWAQVLFGFSVRRGYIPHGIDSSDTEGKKVLTAIAGNAAAIADGNYRSVGEMLYRTGHSRNRGGDYSLCVSNEMLLAEIALLFKNQRSFGNAHAGEDFEKKFVKCVTWQKDVSGNDAQIYAKVGRCTYFPEERRAANCCLTSELCRAYEALGRIRYLDAAGAEHALSPATRDYAMNVLFSPTPIKGNVQCKVTYANLRIIEGLEADAFFKGIESDAEKKQKVFEPKIWAAERDSLPSELMALMASDRVLADKIGSALAYASSEKSLNERLDGLSLSEEHVKALRELSFDTKKFSGYGSRSLKAMDLLVDAFESSEDVLTLYDAEKACGLFDKRLGKGEKGQFLPIYQAYDPTCTNPVVLRVMSRLRKIVNQIVRTYGPVDEIHIELGRELKRSKRERKAIEKANKKRAQARDINKVQLSESLGCDSDAIPGKLLRKYELWLEQKQNDIYTGEAIPFERLIHESNFCEIDHILPYSRTCDDSQANKVLVLNSSNQQKGARTPCEWMTEDGLDWEGFMLRVQRMGGYPARKKEKLLNTDLLKERESYFIERNLNDTRYASRSLKDYIERNLAFRENGRRSHVLAVAGGATAALRDAWGIRKDRSESDLHHAVDAAVVAACNASAVQKIARASESKAQVPKEQRKELFAATKPWDDFVEKVLAKADGIVPTRKPEHGVTGRLFEDFTYSFKGLNDKGTKGVLSRSGSDKVSSNYVEKGDASAKIVDGLAFLRLWWDPQAKKGNGQYVAEPVYYADLPAALASDYEPKMAPPQFDKKPRALWNPIPASARTMAPLVLFRGDAIRVNGTLRRFHGFNINTNAWLLDDPTGKTDQKDATRGLSFISVNCVEGIALVHEDILGLCYRDDARSEEQG